MLRKGLLSLLLMVTCVVSVYGQDDAIRGASKALTKSTSVMEKQDKLIQSCIAKLETQVDLTDKCIGYATDWKDEAARLQLDNAKLSREIDDLHTRLGDNEQIKGGDSQPVIQGSDHIHFYVSGNVPPCGTPNVNVGKP